MKKNSAIQAYADKYVEEELLSVALLSVDTKLYKVAFAEEGVASVVKQYLSNHFDKDDPVSSVINLLAPAAIRTIFGGGILGTILGLAAAALHIDVAGILSSIYDYVKPLIEGGKVPEKSEIQSVVSDAVDEHTESTTTAGEDIFYGFESKSFDQKIRIIRKCKLMALSKKTAITSDWGKRILKWLFTTIFATILLTVGGDVINYAVGRPSAFTQNVAKPEKTEKAVKLQAPQPTQTKFKLISSYNVGENRKNRSGQWEERGVYNTDQGISDMLVSFVKSVYSGLNNLDNIIKSSPRFNKVKNDLLLYNHQSQGDVGVLIPNEFQSRKQLVDLFIDDVAERAK
jgi:hypothetical protein